MRARLAAALALLLAGAAPAGAQVLSFDRCRGHVVATPFARYLGAGEHAYFVRVENRSNVARSWRLAATGFDAAGFEVRRQLSGGPLPPGGQAVVSLGRGTSPDVSAQTVRVLYDAGLVVGEPAVLLSGCAARDADPLLPGISAPGAGQATGLPGQDPGGAADPRAAGALPSGPGGAGLGGAGLGGAPAAGPTDAPLALPPSGAIPPGGAQGGGSGFLPPGIERPVPPGLRPR